ncbi:MAG: hypothetical protein P4L91_04800 [Burkholderiaceae bacterium]|nr:hypothetical protein [Burkholderiaceae bacterium]
MGSPAAAKTLRDGKGTGGKFMSEKPSFQRTSSPTGSGSLLLEQAHAVCPSELINDRCRSAGGGVEAHMANFLSGINPFISRDYLLAITQTMCPLAKTGLDAEQIDNFLMDCLGFIRNGPVSIGMI